ncbi:unnamed protein product [Kuraishia capsulata CBS 1993]|uniref:Serine/threonine-protein kinase ATG1 n=1 Tax=Kuraishia capsulata CBS 1993 TaxID=1382522 RepID=W6MFX9_9ASCO|nr:uncharacterized protein KUCA_T00000527001 [Kuraishia capsulata CBS 1993]CDK24561.1 unnamed protein product [Kuraishia capsulata CBS 1993]
MSSHSRKQIIGTINVGPEIGRGSFANVYKGYDRVTNQPVAIKSVIKSRLKNNKKLIENLEIEISILKNMKHPHIVGLLEHHNTPDHIHLIMEYCSLGDLSYFIRKRDQLVQTHPLISSILERYPSPPNSHGLNKVILGNFLKQLASALEFLRDQNLVHRDIKPQNLLLSPPPHSKKEFEEKGFSGLWELPVLKIADFGFARFLPSTSMAETLCGSPLYMAPEILRYEKYNAKADLWSVGAVIYEMAVGKPPFRASNHVELLKKIEKNKDRISFPSSAQVPEDIMRLISGLLKANPTERMGFQEFFNDPLITADIHCVDEPLACSNIDENLFISEYLPVENAARRFGKGLTEEMDVIPQQRHANAPMTISKPVDPANAVERSKSSSPPEFSVAKTISRPGRAATGSDETIKRLIHKSSPVPENMEASIGGARPLVNRSTTGYKDRSDIVVEKDYVVVEKTAVEVNALADELENARIGTGGLLRHASSPVPSLSGRRYSSSRSSASSHRRPSFGDRKIPISISPTNALTKALAGLASNRLFGSPQALSSQPMQQSQTQQALSLQLNQNLLMPMSSQRLALPSQSQTNATDVEIVQQLEILATMAHAISLFAEVKFSQLIPLPPSTHDYMEGVPDNDDELPPQMTKGLAEEGVALYVKTLSLLAKAMTVASDWWHQNSTNHTASPRLNELVQWIRMRFNESLERAEFVRLRLTEANEKLITGSTGSTPLQNSGNSSSSSFSSAPVAEKLIFDRALEMSRNAALNELRSEDFSGCELSYSTAIWMLEALLDSDLTSENKLDSEDKKTIEMFVSSIGNRLKVLKQKIEKQENEQRSHRHISPV